jgi:hypothetical protein
LTRTVLEYTAIGSVNGHRFLERIYVGLFLLLVGTTKPITFYLLIYCFNVCPPTRMRFGYLPPPKPYYYISVAF